MDNFIKIHHNAVSNEICEYFIEFFKKQKKLGHTYSGTSSSGVVKKHIKDAEDINLRYPHSKNPNSNKDFYTSHHLKMLDEYENIIEDLFIKYIDYYHPHSSSKFKSLSRENVPWLDDNPKWTGNQPLMHVYEPPSQGYHALHCDWSSSTPRTAKRMMVGMLYLNDVYVGGQTEFPNQQLSVQPTQGTVVIWPAYFTHLHRGHPPISNTKYIVNKWCIPTV